MGAANFGRAILAVDADEYVVTAPVEADALGIDAQIDTLAFEGLAYLGGDVGIFAMDEARGHLDHSHLAAEAAIHLREFEPDIAAADDHKMPRQKIDRHHRAVRQIGNLIEPGQFRH